MHHQTHRVLNSLRWAMLALAILNLFAFLARFGFSRVDFRYWYDGLVLALLLIAASVFTLFHRRWSKVVGALLTLPMVLLFCYAALKVHAILPSSPAEQTLQRDPASWRQFLWDHPDVLLQYVVAFIVFIVAIVDFVRSIRTRPVALETGG